MYVCMYLSTVQGREQDEVSVQGCERDEVPFRDVNGMRFRSGM